MTAGIVEKVAMHPLFERRGDLGKNVHILTTAVEMLDPRTNPESSYVEDDRSWEIRSHCDYVVATHMVLNFLSVPKVKTPRERRQMSAKELRDWECRRTRYQSGKEWMSRALAEAAVHFSLPRVVGYSVSPMEMPLHTEIVEPLTPVAVVKVARGGEKPSNVCVEVLKGLDPLLDPCVLYSIAQRNHEDDGGHSIIRRQKITVDHSEKGTENLDGYDVIVAEQALATGGTSKTVIEAFKQRCGGVPASLTFIFLHGNEEGIRAIVSEYPEATVIVGCLHAGMNDLSFLIYPGCGDLGAHDNNVQD